MDIVTNRHEKERAHLRRIYDKAVSDLLQALKSEPKATYSTDDLTKLQVALTPFDPGDRSFLESKACLFKPLRTGKLREFFMPISDLPQSSKRSYCDFDAIYHSVGDSSNAAYVKRKRTEQTFRYLRVYYTFLRRKSAEELDLFKDSDGWCEIHVGNSFLDDGTGLLFGSWPPVPEWDVRAQREWLDNPYDLETASPHIMLVICTEDDATNSDELLFSEIGSIAQAIRKRLNQEEFQKTSFFPVLAISFFGPRHGRILQANFTKFGILKVRASPIYSFVNEAEAPFDLLLCYYACKPQGGLDYEFYSDEEDASTTYPGS